MEISASHIHDEIAKVCPIRGVRIGKLNDKGSWIVDYDPSSTAPQRAAALAAIQAIDVTVPIVRDPVDALDIVVLKVAFNHENRIRALEGKSAVTLAQFKAAIRSLL